MFYVTSYYIFKQLEPNQQQQIESDLYRIAENENWNGLIILGPEGINATMANDNLVCVEKFKKWLLETFATEDVLFKDSTCEKQPFRRFIIHTREEIVTLGHPEMVPNGRCRHLSPEEWQAVIDSSEEYVLLDTRNFYETEVGVFKGAIDPKISTFGEFSNKIPELNLPKDKKILMYCTGGIRCEKAILAMEHAGYDNCYQLEGGILAYFEKFPNKSFDGECFVFDHRVAVDQNLEASKQYSLCPHCGNAGNVKITCSNCSEPAQVCQHCLDLEKDACSKNCQHHIERKRLASRKVAA